MSFVFTPVDLNHYARREHFERFRAMNLTYSATVPIDITDLRARLKLQDIRPYIAQIWLLSAVVNRIQDLRMSVSPEGTLGTFDLLHPMYTALNKETHSFSSIWTPWNPDFHAFHAACVADLDRHTTGAYLPQDDVPVNLLNISSIPWVDFSSFNLNMPGDYTLPIFTIGKYMEADGRTVMPLAIQLHHATCDGYHLGLLVDTLRELIAMPDTWLV